MSQVILLDPVRREQAMRSREGRRRKNALFLAACVATAFLSVGILVLLLGAITIQGYGYLSASFLTSPPDPDPAATGIAPALFGSIYVCLVCALFTLPIGVATAVFLEEFKPRRRWVRRFHGFVQLNIMNLAGVPSVVYGIIGLTAFVSMFGLARGAGEPVWEFGVEYRMQYLSEAGTPLLIPVDAADAVLQPESGMWAYTPRGRRVELNVIPSEGAPPDDPDLQARTLRADAVGGVVADKAWYYTRVPFGRGVLAGGLTLMLVILPVLIIASQEALRAVPGSLRDGALGLGATRWQTIRRVTLPAAVPGIMTGSIISMSRAIGEAAPILMLGGIIYITSAPRHLMDDFTVMPLQIFDWAGRPQEAFHRVAASGIIVLLAVLLSFNAVAVVIRQKLQKPLS